jgi:hypothetical protein
MNSPANAVSVPVGVGTVNWLPAAVDPSRSPQRMVASAAPDARRTLPVTRIFQPKYAFRMLPIRT